MGSRCGGGAVVVITHVRQGRGAPLAQIHRRLSGSDSRFRVVDKRSSRLSTTSLFASLHTPSFLLIFLSTVTFDSPLSGLGLHVSLHPNPLPITATHFPAAASHVQGTDTTEELLSLQPRRPRFAHHTLCRPRWTRDHTNPESPVQKALA
jgi:hypothetical protein